jgi:hypothetical protein
MAEGKKGGGELAEQLKGLERYAKKCGEGFAQLDGYLKSLSAELDGFLDTPLNPNEAGKIQEAHSGYKDNLVSAEKQIANYSVLEKLVKKVLSGSIGTQEEATRTISEIEKSYQAVVGGALAVYQLIDPQIDASGLIGGLYSKLAATKNKDVKPLFSKGLTLLRQYYVTSEMIEQIRSRAGNRPRRPETEEMPRAA